MPAAIEISKEQTVTAMSSYVLKLTHGLLVAYIVGVICGCSLSKPTNNPFAASMSAPNGKPTVWACALAQMTSPPKYACSDNKTYTAFELRDARLGVETPKVASK
jgi:hypothetical protein